MSTPILEAVEVTKSYFLGRREIPVLRGVDLRIQAGEMVALLGASGAGKSTLLHVLGLLDRPQRGAIHFEGQPAHSLPSARRAALRHRHIGFVFQFYHLIPELNALQNVLLGQMMLRGPLEYWGARREVRARAKALLERVGLQERQRHRPSELSGGEKQRVAIARALIAEPKVILADEPTGNLDSKTSGEVLELLFNLNRERGLAFLLVTHNEQLAQRCDRVVRMADGVLVD